MSVWSVVIGIGGVMLCALGTFIGTVTPHDDTNASQHLFLTGITLLAIAIK